MATVFIEGNPRIGVNVLGVCWESNRGAGPGERKCTSSGAGEYSQFLNQQD